MENQAHSLSAFLGWSVFNHIFQNAGSNSTPFLDFHSKKPISGLFSTTPNGNSG